MNKTVYLAASSLAILALASPVAAQESQETDETNVSSGGIEEIVVTAQRRQESVQDVPIAVSAFSNQQLESQGVSSTLELGQFVPNMAAQNNTGLGSANAYYLRGLGNTETIATFDPPVGTYVDDIYLSRQNANNLSMFDVERIEVLRGPQGTLFGRNTTGGAISVVMRDPGDSFGGYAEIGYGRFNKKIARASVDIPLADTLSVKLSGYWQDDDGYARNVTTGQRVNDDDGWGVRLGVKGQLSDSVRWTAGYAHIVADGENIPNFTCNPKVPTECDGRYVTTGYRSGGSAETSPFAPLVIRGRKANYLMGNYTQSDLINSNLAIDLNDDITLNLITGFVAQAQQYGIDFADGRSLPSLSNPRPAAGGWVRGGFTILNDGTHSQFSQEAKISGKLANGFIDFVGGVFYLREENRTDLADTLSLSPVTTLLLADRILRNTTKAFAGYVQADFNVTDQIKLTAGIRYTDERKSLSLSDNRPSCNDAVIEASCLTTNNLVAPSGVAVPTRQTAKVWTPRFAASYSPTNDLMLFASATRGFKSGGWNARGTAVNTFLPFDPEKVWSYEAGFKSDWLDKRLRFNVTLFRMDVSDLQTPSALVAPSGAITFLTRNFADYRNQGIEAELTIAPADGLTLYGTLGYQDDKYLIDRSAPATDIYGIQSVAAQQAACLAALAAGRIPGGTDTASCASGIITPDGQIATPVRTPNLTASMGASYKMPLGESGLSLVPSVNASYRSHQEVGTANYTIYSGSITGTNGTYPANPYAGDFIVGSSSEATWLINASLALNGPDEKWQLSAGCTNCFDQSYVQSTLANVNYISQPMSWTVRARYRF